MRNITFIIFLFIVTNTNAQTPTQLLTECQSLNALTISQNLKKLQKFPLSDFDQTTKNKVATLLQKNPPHLNRLYKLAGFLDMNKELSNFNPSEIKSKKDKQALKLAMVRSGDYGKLLNLLENVKEIPINDEFVFEIVPILIYTRQKQCTDYLMELVMSDDLNCTPADAETPGEITCAYRIMEALAPVVLDFPYEVDYFGDLITDDYPKALANVRAWIRANKSNYQLNTTIY